MFKEIKRFWEIPENSENLQIFSLKHCTVAVTRREDEIHYKTLLNYCFKALGPVYIVASDGELTVFGNACEIRVRNISESKIVAVPSGDVSHKF